MFKKTFKMLFALCCMLVLTSTNVLAAANTSVNESTILASKSDKLRYFHYSILSNDTITDHANGRERNIYLTGHILVSYQKGGERKYTISVNDVNFQSINANSSEYRYVVEEMNDYGTRLNLLRNNQDICYVTFSVSSSGQLNTFMHNIH